MSAWDMPTPFDSFLKTRGTMQQQDIAATEQQFNLAKLSQLQRSQELDNNSRQLGMKIAQENLDKQNNPAPNAVTLANLSEVPDAATESAGGRAVAMPSTTEPPKQSEILSKQAAELRNNAQRYAAIGDIKTQQSLIDEARKTDEKLYQTQAEERKADAEKKKAASAAFGAVNSQEALDAAVKTDNPEHFKAIAPLFNLGLDGKPIWDDKAKAATAFIARASMDAAKQAEFDHKALMTQIATQKAEIEAERAKTAARQGDERIAIAREGLAKKPDMSAVSTAMSDDAKDSAAARYNIDGTLPPNMGRGVQGAALTADILSRAAQQQKDSGNTAESTRITQLANKANTQALGQLTKQEQMVGAFEKNAIRNADVALANSEKVDRTGVPVLNRWILAGQKNLAGDPDVSKFHQANETFVNEYAKIMSGSMGNTVVSDSLRKETQSMLATKDTPEQYRQVVAQMKLEMRNRMKGFADQKAELTGSMKPKTDTPEAPAAVTRPPLSSFQQN